MKWNSKARSAIAVICAAAGLVGCATGTKEARMDGAPLMPASAVAKIALHPAESFSGHALNTRWAVDIISIDGVAVPQNTGLVQVSPGEHTLEYNCLYKFSLNDLGGALSKNKKAKFSLQAGKTYYAYAKGSIHTSKYSGGYHESTGTCSVESLSEDNPFFHQ